MFKSTVLILIVGANCINGTLFQENKKCPTTRSKHYQAVWPETNNWTLSDPPCVDKNKQFLYRKCINGEWDTEPECDYVQQKILSQCPDDFTEATNLCYKISNRKEKFPPKCLHQDILPFEMYRNLMENNGPFWMPVVRNLSNGLGFFTWIETSSLYKTNFEGTYRYNGTIKDKNCLLYYNSSYIEAVSCDEEHLSICAYKKFNEIVDDLCSSKNRCVQSDFMNKTKCICKATEDSSNPKAEFLQLFQNNVYLKLANETCSSGLIHSNGTYIWNNSRQEISYTYWSPQTIFDGTHIYGASTPSGWILTENQPSCFLFEKDIQKPKEPILLLTFDLQLQVTVYYNVSLKKVDSHILLYCFTDASALDLIYRYTNFTQNHDYNYYDYDDDINLSYMFEPLEDGPGNYWCESFNYVSMEVVKSNTQFIDESIRNGYEFVAILRLVYENINPLSKDIIEFVNNNVFTQLYKLEHFKMSYNLRIMKIVDVDEVGQQILINIHLTAKNVSNGDHDEEYNIVKKLLEENLSQLKIEMLEFSSVGYCMNETMGNLHWPTTSQGSVNVSTEYCFESDGTRLSRLCQADFINGAKWAPLNGTCEIANQSSITKKLLKVFEDLDPASLLAISKKHDKFLPLDIYLFGNIFKKFSNYYFSGLDPDTFIEIISNLMEVDQNILIESKAMKATDAIIETISTYFEIQQNTYESCQKNFFVKIQYAYTFGGISIKKDYVDLCTGAIQTFNSGYDIKEVIGDEIEAAVLLHKDVNSQSQENAMVLVLSKNSFFIEKPSTKTLSKIFRIIVTGLHELEPLAGPTLLLQNVENNTQKTCSFWNYVDDSGGSWQKRSDSEPFDLYQSCNFTDTPYFALTSSDEIKEKNVTDILEEILESNTSVSQKMTNLRQVSKKFQEFKSFDVFLVGKILEQVNQNKDIDLETLAETISNLQRIQKEILQESQIEKMATDSILYSIDKILTNHDYQKPIEVIKDNFMILIYDTNKTDFSGLALLEHNHTYQLMILEGDIDIHNVSVYKNLDSALVLSEGLKRQFQEESRVVVTFFTNNSLFNELKPSSRGVNRIFGVILPEISKYSGPITILQKIVKNDTQEQCVHWNYNTTVSGSWLRDRDGKELFSLIECEFWHTTHFAVLLVDDDKYQNDQVLEWITNISCLMSFLGLFCIFLTGIFFQKWRKNSGNKILLNFAFAMMFQIVLLYVSSNTNRNSHNSLLCTTIGMLLHYSVVSEFCWMLIIAFLQYKRFVKVLGGPPQHMLLKGCLVGWLFPLFPVVLVFTFGSYNNIHDKVNLCYPSGLGLYLGVWFPVSTIILINSAFFASILYSVFYKKTDCSSGTNSELIFQWRLVLLLFFILGLSWVFGFLCMMDFGVVFAYLFCMSASMQGFVLFLFFIVFNVNTRLLYMQACKRKCFKN